MVKEPKNIDFLTTGRHPSVQDFERISEWIRKNKLSARFTKKLPADQDRLLKKGISAANKLSKG